MAGFRPENRVIGLRRFTAAFNRILRPRRKIHKNPRHVRGFLYKTEQKFRPSGGTFVPPGFVRAAGSAYPFDRKRGFDRESFSAPQDRTQVIRIHTPGGLSAFRAQNRQICGTRWFLLNAALFPA